MLIGHTLVPIDRLYRPRTRKAHAHIHPCRRLRSYRTAYLRLQRQRCRFGNVQHRREYLWLCTRLVQDGSDQEHATIPVYEEVSWPERAWSGQSDKADCHCSTILKKYDGRFKDIFQEVYES